MLTLYAVICLFILQDLSVNATLRVIMNDVTIEALDREYFDPENTELHIVENDDTGDITATSKLTIVKPLPEDTEIRLRAKALTMGKYISPTGIDMTMTFCEALDEPIAIGPFFAALGFSSASCPPGPGTYSSEGYKPPMDDLPDQFPENKYSVLFEITSSKKQILAINLFTSVEME